MVRGLYAANVIPCPERSGEEFRREDLLQRIWHDLYQCDMSVS
jgi:hypothetical protein